MKKLSRISIVLFCAVLMMSFTPTKETPVKKSLNASLVMLPVGKDGKKISLQELSNISRKELEKITGRKMSLPERIAFKATQRKLRNSINEQGEINDKKLKKVFGNAGDGGGFHLGGFALGFLLGLIGILIAYLMNDDLKKQRVKWAWIGLLAWVVILVLVVI